MATPSGQASTGRSSPPTLTSPRSQEEPRLKEQRAKLAEPPALGPGSWSQSRGLAPGSRAKIGKNPLRVGPETWGRKGWIH